MAWLHTINSSLALVNVIHFNLKLDQTIVDSREFGVVVVVVVVVVVLCFSIKSVHMTWI